MFKTRFALGGSLLTFALFGYGALANADDAPKTSSSSSSSSSSSPSAPTTTRKPVYITVGDLIGEVVEVNSSSVKLKVTWTTVTAPTGGAPVNPGNWNRGTHPRTAKQLYEHQVKMQQAMARHMAYLAAHSKVHVHKSEYLFDFTDDAQARLQNLPPKLDENGKKVAYTPAEKQKLKGNPDIPGWKADISELKVGQVLEAHIVQLQTADKQSDKKDLLLLRWALILNDPSEVAENKKNK
jgi:hypothetical protein